MRRRHLFLILAFALVVSSWATLRAECVGFPLEHYVEYADLVFLGTVRDVQLLDVSKQIVTFDVSRVWKGSVSRSVTLYQAPWVAFDSYEFSAQAVGVRYLVFATRLLTHQRGDFDLDDGIDAFAVPACGGGTLELRDGREAPRQLGAGHDPIDKHVW